MDKKLFIEVLRSYTANSGQDAAEIIALKKTFPFSQALQVLSAKVSKDHQTSSQQQELQQAAVYCTDRAVLKEIMTMDLVAEAPVEPAMQTRSVVSEISVHPKNNDGKTSVMNPTAGNIEPTQSSSTPRHLHLSEEKLVVYQQIEKTIDHVDLADTVIRDLKKLSELKHNFELLFAEQSAMSVAVHPEKKEESGKSRREKIIQIARSAGQSSQPPITDGKKKRKIPSSDIIEEIETSKEEIEPGNERLKEQIQIIDQFIKTQPSITSVRDRNPLPPTDLNSIKSGEFGENIVSETLVEILVKQGKKDRAIEVLKKLIWKYPQKKAYFASQIEDLKK